MAILNKIISIKKNLGKVVFLKIKSSSDSARISNFASSARLSSENFQLGSARLAKIQLEGITSVK